MNSRILSVFVILSSLLSAGAQATSYDCIKPAIAKGMQACNDEMKAQGKSNLNCALEGISVVDSATNVFEVDTFVNRPFRTLRLNFVIKTSFETGKCEATEARRL